MKKQIMLVILAVGVILLQRPLQLIAEDVTPVEIQKVLSPQEQVEQLADIYSKKYKVSKSSILKTIKNENTSLKFDQQSNLKYKKGNRWKQPAGSREKSYGIAQIHLPDHPDVSYEEAIDPEFAVEFMAREFANGNQSWWMGYEK